MSKYIPIIGICGNKGAGKDTLASEISKILSDSSSPVKTHHLAEPFKRYVQKFWMVPFNVLNGDSALREEKVNGPTDIIWSEHNENAVRDFLREIDIPPHFHRQFTDKVHEWLEMPDLTVRQLLQKVGTDFFRKIKPDVWLEYTVKKAIQDLSTNSNLILIPDVRFRNEILGLKAKNGYIVRLDRRLDSKDTHKSETEMRDIPNYFFNKVVDLDMRQITKEKMKDIAQEIWDDFRIGV